MNSDWYVTTGGDGFRSQVDPEDPNTIYSESQYGVLVRYDKADRTGTVAAAAGRQRRTAAALELGFADHHQPAFPYAAIFRGEQTVPHRRSRRYMEGNPRRSDAADRSQQVAGDGKSLGTRMRWRRITSTSFYGNIVALAESPKKEGLIYVGTDDGLIQVTSDGGGNWTKYEKFPGVPEKTYVSRLAASNFDANTVYAAFDNHKNEDFKPYLLKSTDSGKTWTSIAGDLPENGPVLAFAEDTVNPNLLFAGTEFGLYLHDRRRATLGATEGRTTDDCRTRHGHPAARKRSGDRDFRARLLCAG